MIDQGGGFYGSYSVRSEALKHVEILVMQILSLSLSVDSLLAFVESLVRRPYPMGTI